VAEVVENLPSKCEAPREKERERDRQSDRERDRERERERERENIKYWARDVMVKCLLSMRVALDFIPSTTKQRVITDTYYNMDKLQKYATGYK
jgi:hypothetical protein